MADFVNALFAGLNAGQRLRQRDDDLVAQQDAMQRQSKLAALAGDAFTAGPGTARDQALANAVRLDPSAGVALQGAVRTDDDSRNTTLANMARLLTSAPEPSRPGLYQQMRPSLQRLGVQAPEQYDATVAQTAQAIVDAFSGAQQGGGEMTATMRSLEQAYQRGLLTEEEYRQGVRAYAGVAPRAASDRFSVQKITMPDGSTGIFQVPTQGTAAGGQWMPGGAMPGLGGGPMPQQAPRPQAAPMPNANPQPGGITLNFAGMEPESIAEAIRRVEASEGRRLTPQEIAQAFASGANPAAPEAAGGPQVVQTGLPAAQPPRAPQAAAPARGAAFAPLGEVGGGDVRMGLGQTGAQAAAQEAEAAAARERAVLTARADVEAEQGAPLEAANRADTLAKIASTQEVITTALGQVSGWTAGGGSLLAAIPGTPAADLRANLDTLQANLGFDELARMRAASPTGGALGAVSERELRLLTSTLRSLERDQSPAQLRENLNKLQRHYTAWAQTVQGAEAGATARVDTQEEFDALPSGATFIDAQDGRIYRKP